jgi:hypothetical protein
MGPLCGLNGTADDWVAVEDGALLIAQVSGSVNKEPAYET